MANRSKSLTMAGKRYTATAGVIAVVLILSKFFPRVYGGVLQGVGQVTKQDPARSSEIVNGIIFITLGLVWTMVARIFSYAPFYRQAWNISGMALVVIGGFLVTGYNPFRNQTQFDPNGYQA